MDSIADISIGFSNSCPRMFEFALFACVKEVTESYFFIAMPSLKLFWTWACPILNFLICHRSSCLFDYATDAFGIWFAAECCRRKGFASVFAGISTWRNPKILRTHGAHFCRWGGPYRLCAFAAGGRGRQGCPGHCAWHCLLITHFPVLGFFVWDFYFCCWFNFIKLSYIIACLSQVGYWGFSCGILISNVGFRRIGQVLIFLCFTRMFVNNVLNSICECWTLINPSL